MISELQNQIKNFDNEWLSLHSVGGKKENKQQELHQTNHFRSYCSTVYVQSVPNHNICGYMHVYLFIHTYKIYCAQYV